MHFYIQRLISLKKIAQAILSIQILGGIILILTFVLLNTFLGFSGNLLTGFAGFSIIFIVLSIILSLTMGILMIVFTSQASSLRFMGPKDMITRTTTQYLYSNSLAATILVWLIITSGIGGLYWFIFSIIAISKLSTLITLAHMSQKPDPNESNGSNETKILYTEQIRTQTREVFYD